MLRYVLIAVAALSICLTSFPSHATWCVAGNSNQGSITPTATSQTTGSLNPSGKVPYWTFSGTAGVVYHFSLCTSANTEDAILNVYDGASPGGNLVASNDEGSCASKSSLSFICPVTQTYYVAANVYPWFQYSTTGGLQLTYYICGSATGASLPFSENWTSNGVTTACSSWMAHGAGGEGDWYRGNPVIPGNPNSAGGTGNEAGFVGNQANLYGVGVAKTVTLTSPKLNTSGVSSLSFSWKHSLGVTNSGASGSNTITIKLQSSSDLINWTDRWTGSYTATASLTTPVWQVTQSVSFNPGSNNTWLRFYLNGVPFKVWGWLIDNGSVLPVEMLSFTGQSQDKNVYLAWETATELNNDYYAVERSTDGQEWNTIGQVKGAGNSSVKRSYEFTDNGVSDLAGQLSHLYYRLKQTDYDGQFEYFGPISVYLTDENGMSLLIENPVSGELKGTLAAEEDSKGSLEIIDLQGRVVLAEPFIIRKGSNRVAAPVIGLDKGLYFVRINNGSRSVTRKFVTG